MTILRIAYKIYRYIIDGKCTSSPTCVACHKGQTNVFACEKCWHIYESIMHYKRAVLLPRMNTFNAFKKGMMLNRLSDE